MRVIEPIVVVVGEEVTPPSRRYRKRRTSRALPRVAGVLATVGIHLLISAPLLLGNAAHKARPIEGLGSVAWASQGKKQESMILLDLSALSAASHDERSTPENMSDDIDSQNFEIALASVEISPPPQLQIEDAEEGEVSNESAGDPAGAAVLFGRYMSQVAARIDRTWMRPRTPIAGGRFDCRARISQDRKGRVLSVELQDCGEDARWRESLTSAIVRASPLSSPPEQWLFAETVTLNFTATQYEADKSSPHLYESEEKRFVRNAPPHPIPDGLDGPGDYDLTVESGELRWKRKDPSAAASK
jgi:hypothetical protein